MGPYREGVGRAPRSPSALMGWLRGPGPWVLGVLAIALGLGVAIDGGYEARERKIQCETACRAVDALYLAALAHARARLGGEVVRFDREWRRR